MQAVLLNLALTLLLPFAVGVEQVDYIYNLKEDRSAVALRAC